MSLYIASKIIGQIYGVKRDIVKNSMFYKFVIINNIMDDSDSKNNPKLILAKWTDRFFAGLIDVVIVLIISTIIMSVAVFESINYNVVGEGILFILYNMVFFTYWIILEYKTSQSIGKKILNLKIVHLNGERASLLGIVSSSFGKSFLLPIDFIMGLIFTNEKRQRIFNKLGDTIVVKIIESENNSGTTFVKD